MPRPAVLVLALLASSVALGQDPPAAREEKDFEIVDVRDLVREPVDQPLAPYGLPVLDGEAASGDGSTPKSHACEGPFLVELLQACVAPGTWEDGDRAVSLTSTSTLLVRGPEALRKEIREFLGRLRAELLSQISVEAVIADLAPGTLATLVAADRPTLPDASLARLQELLKAGVDAHPVERLRLTPRSGELRSAARRQEARYIADLDRDPDAESPVLAARLASVATGAGLEVRVSRFDRTTLVLDWRFAGATLAGEPEKFAVGPDLHVQLPTARRLGISGRSSCLNTATVLAGTLPSPDRPGWDRVVLLRPQLDSKEGARGDRPVELYDVQPLVRGPGEESAPGGLMSGEELVELIRGTDEEAWDEAAGHSVTFVNGVIVARNEAPELERVRALLRKIADGAAAPVRLDFALVSAKPGALGGAGEAITPAVAARLLAAAREGRDATLAWQGGGWTTPCTILAIEDLSERAIVAGYRREATLHDPRLELVSTGIRLGVRPSLDADSPGIRLQDCRVEYSWLEEPVAAAALPGTGGLKLHLPRRTNHEFGSQAVLEPEEWTSLGASPAGDETLVLLARASRGRLPR